MSRADLIERRDDASHDGRVLADIVRRVAIPTESQRPDRPMIRARLIPRGIW